MLSPHITQLSFLSEVGKIETCEVSTFVRYPVMCPSPSNRANSYRDVALIRLSRFIKNIVRVVTFDMEIWSYC